MTPAQRVKLIESIEHSAFALRLIEDSEVVHRIREDAKPDAVAVRALRHIRNSVKASVCSHMPARSHDDVEIWVDMMLQTASVVGHEDLRAVIERDLDTILSHRCAVDELGELST